MRPGARWPSTWPSQGQLVLSPDPGKRDQRAQPLEAIEQKADISDLSDEPFPFVTTLLGLAHLNQA